MSSDPRTVARNRLAYSVNMWRDYESEQGAAVETVPGFRRVFKEEDDHIIRQIWHYKGNYNNYIIVAHDWWIYAINIDGNYENQDLYARYGASAMVGFFANNCFYILGEFNDGENAWKGFLKIYETSDGVLSAERVESTYVPTTYYNGKPYEQRNSFSNRVIEVYSDGGEVKTHQNNPYDPESVLDVCAFKIHERVKGVDMPIDLHLNIKSVNVNGESFNLASIQEFENGNLSTSKHAFTKEDGDYSKEYFADDSSYTIEGDRIEYYPTELIIPKEHIFDGQTPRRVEIIYEVDPIHFNTIGNLVHFQDNKLTMAEAILGCTKSAVYDGRVFLTGNPDLPNTVFYSQRNLTGANDPTYFGVYNYFNDGEGNVPNVDLLATPSMLMVIKGDTTQEGSIFYHTAQFNTDEASKDLVPKIYPSTQGAAGLGSAGTTETYSLSCNFLDDPVLISRRGLEGVSKEQLNAERTLGHRSSNVDRLLVKEDLAHASLAEWKGYLVICCNGHIYLADSRSITQGVDGAHQYEWFYLEGVGTYKSYTDEYKYLTSWPEVYLPTLLDGSTGEAKEYGYVAISNLVDSNGKMLKESTFLASQEEIVSEDIVVNSDYVKYELNNKTIYYNYVSHWDESSNEYKYLVGITGAKKGSGEFYGAKRVLAVGDLLFFATDYDICVFNTDKRGEDGRIPSEWYNFNGVAYKSACATRLDDCDKKSLTKNTIYGTTAARFKMIPGSRCKVKASINGRDWEDVGEANLSRMDFADIRFDDFAFAEDEDDLTVLPELSRGWVHKQYYFYSDGFCEPFGLYELSYIYKIAGKIRYI